MLPHVMYVKKVGYSWCLIMETKGAKQDRGNHGGGVSACVGVKALKIVYSNSVVMQLHPGKTMVCSCLAA